MSSRNQSARSSLTQNTGRRPPISTVTSPKNQFGAPHTSRNTENQNKTARVHVEKVSHAKYFEKFRELPKYSHKELACINPVPKQLKPKKVQRPPLLELESNTLEIKPRAATAKNIPQHLIKPPIVHTPVAEAPIKKSDQHPSGRPLTLKEKKAALEEQKKLQAEARKLAKSLKLLNLMFTQLKAQLLDNKMEDESISKELHAITVSEAKNLISQGNFIQTLYSETMKEKTNYDYQLTKHEFSQFIKHLLPKMTDFEITEVFNYIVLKVRKDELKSYGTGSYDKKITASDTLDLNQLDQLFEKWFEEEDSINSFTSVKLVQQRFKDFKTKLEIWSQKEKNRQSQQKAYKRHNLKIIDLIQQAKREFTFERELVLQCETEFSDIQADFSRYFKEERVINDFLKQLPINVNKVEIQDLERASDKLDRAFQAELQVIEDFALVVKQDYVMEKFYFNFFDMPDLIVKMKYTRKDYELVIKMLKKVKKQWLDKKLDDLIQQKLQDEFKNKQNKQEDNDLEEKDLIEQMKRDAHDPDSHDQHKDLHVEITDEDNVPLAFFEDALVEIQHKNRQKIQSQKDFIQACKDEIVRKQKELGCVTPKQKDQVQDATVSQLLNSTLDENHSKVVTSHFKHNLLYLVFSSKDRKPINAADFKQQFDMCLQSDQSHSKYFLEWREKFIREMQIFSGKIQGKDDETASLMSGATGISGGHKANSNRAAIVEQTAKEKHRMSRLAGHNPQKPLVNFKLEDETKAKGHGVDRMLDAMRLGETDGIEEFATLNDIDGKSSVFNTRDSLNNREEEKFNEEEEKLRKKNEEKEYMAQFFLSQDQKPYDPVKKFGTIDDHSQLIYDNISTSYALNLPADYYLKQIQRSMPGAGIPVGKKDKDAHLWFIRPHHLENLTQHPNSIKDDFLNTRYLSNYNQDYGKVPQLNRKEIAIKCIEEELEWLKQNQVKLARQRNIDLSNLDDLKRSEAKRAFTEYEKLIKKREKVDDRVLCIEAYEQILYDKRKLELDILNHKRGEEIDKNRPPLPGWYMGNGKEFSKELFRNRVEMRPRGQNKEYLQTLMDPRLY